MCVYNILNLLSILCGDMRGRNPFENELHIDIKNPILFILKATLQKCNMRSLASLNSLFLCQAVSELNLAFLPYAKG